MATGKKGGAKMASDAERLDQESGVDRKQENPYAIKVRMDRLLKAQGDCKHHPRRIRSSRL